LCNEVFPNLLLGELYQFYLDYGSDTIFFIFVINSPIDLSLHLLNGLHFIELTVFIDFVHNPQHPLHYHLIDKERISEAMVPLTMVLMH